MLTSLFINLLATATGLGFATLIIAGIKVKTFAAFLMAAAVLGLINVFIRPLLWLLTAPLSVITFGLFALVINALMIRLTAAIVPGFEVSSFGSAFFGAVIMAIISTAGFIIMLLVSGVDINWSHYEYPSLIQ